LTYFADPSERYFLNGHIDLRYGIQAGLVDGGKDGKESKDPTAFIITTDQRKLYFRADTVTSAKEWVKAIQKAIFRTRNEGDSVKICIPTSSVMAVEDIPLPGAQKTIRLNVVDSDDTYTIDDVSNSLIPESS
jgi:sterol 3beta-glucosyltransferase